MNNETSTSAGKNNEGIKETNCRMIGTAVRGLRSNCYTGMDINETEEGPATPRNDNNKNLTESDDDWSDDSDDELNDAFLTDKEDDFRDVEMDEILEVEEDLPLNDDSPERLPNNTSYSTADWITSNSSSSSENHNVARGYVAALSIAKQRPSASERELQAREERKQKMRDEESLMRGLGFTYISPRETWGEEWLGNDPYHRQFRVKQRSILRRGWFLNAEDESEAGQGTLEQI